MGPGLPASHRAIMHLTETGSLLLGLYDREGNLQHVGVCANFTSARRGELVEYLRPYRPSNIDGHPWKVHNCRSPRAGEPI
jgi:hypothetical protein